MLSLSRLKVSLMICLLLAACRGEAWQADPAVIAAREACAGLSDIEKYSCIEQQALAALNPEICRLAGIWIDDACLQAVYEAANDPAICDLIYLQGVVPNCRAYYAKYTPSKSPATEVVLAQTQAASPATTQGIRVAPSQANPPPPGSIPTTSTTPKRSTTEQEWQLYISSREGYPAIYAVHPDGSGLTKLMDEYAGIYEAALSPDGAKIAFTANSPDDGAWDIFVMDVDGANISNLTSIIVDANGNTPSYQSGPAWSPDGNWLAFTSDGDIFAMAMDGSRPVRLTDHPGWDSAPSWSPDGTQIAFSSQRGDDPDIYLVTLDGLTLKRLTGSPQADRDPLWSTDGSKIYYLSDHDEGSDIYIMNVDGSDQTNLTQNVKQYSALHWHPDGAHIVFSAYGDDRNRLYLMNADGSLVVPLPEPLPGKLIEDWGYSAALSALASVATTPTVIPAPTLVLSAEDEEKLALKTLLDFFDLLHAGEYEQASHLYGGSYETLMYLNPSIYPKDKEAYFKNGCEINGLQCLRVSEAVLQEPVLPHEFRFIVEFKIDDGTRFVLRPCCGATETEMPPKWQFPYTVKRVGDHFRVMELPLLMP